eukprot:643333-Hanusia_phi.AAC.2
MICGRRPRASDGTVLSHSEAPSRPPGPAGFTVADPPAAAAAHRCALSLQLSYQCSKFVPESSEARSDLRCRSRLLGSDSDRTTPGTQPPRAAEPEPSGRPGPGLGQA